MSLRAAAPAAVLASLLAVSACKTASKAAPDAGGPDAAPSAAAAVDAAPPRRDPTLRIVATGSYDLAMTPTGDGRLVVLAGSVPYEAKADGSLEPVVALDALAPVFPESESLIGYPDAWVPLDHVDGALGDGLFVGSMGVKKRYAVASGKLQAAPPLETHLVVRWRDRSIGAMGRRLVAVGAPADDAPVAELPSGITSLAVRGDGALVALSLGKPGKLLAYVLPPSWKGGDAPATFERESSRGCRLVPAFDGSVVVQCPGAKEGSTLERLEAGGFRRVFEDAPSAFGAASIGKDGALYVTDAGELAVRRCPAPRGACSKIPLAGETEGLPRIEYEAAFSDVIDPETSRNWQGLHVTTSRVATNEAQAVFARAEDDVWVVARAAGRSALLHAGSPKPLVQLPSPLDARVLVRNAKPAQPWTGHCEHVFVRLGARDADAIAKRAPEIQKALGTEPNGYEAAHQWALVEGRLHDDHVVGVVVMHRDPEAKLADMERAVERLVAAFATSPTSRPPVTCTLPVLERRVLPEP